MRLALAGNPSVLLLLFVPEEQLELVTPAGRELRDLAPAFVCARVRDAYAGYMGAQKERLLGERGQARVKRPELIAAHGYDTKYAMHTLRLGLQGIELLETGRLSLPMHEPDRTTIMAVRQGEVGFADAVQLIEEAETRLLACAPGVHRSRTPPGSSAGWWRPTSRIGRPAARSLRPG